MRAETRWPIGVAAVLAITVGANAYLLYRATEAPSPIESDYYRKAIEWDSTMAQARRNQALGWHLRGRLDRDGHLLARVTTRDERPIAGATVVVEAFSVALADGGAPVALPPVGSAYEGRVPVAGPGLYELRFDVVSGSDRFTSVLRGLPGGPLEAKP
jgi:nitrogen fixation protein FixH